MSTFIERKSLAYRGAGKPFPEDLQGGCPGLSPLVLGLLWNRGCRTVDDVESYLRPTEALLRDPFLLRHLDRAVALLRDTLERGRKILIHGDYDADGICATALLRQAFEELGADVGYHVPDRFEEGYGLSMKAVDRCRDEGFALLLSVDCGSSSHREIEAAQALGITVIVTDHHRVPENPPDPDAFVNPQHPLDSSPFCGFCGTAVAFKLVQGLLGCRGAEPGHLLDLVALATVADVVPLEDENRALVALGLEELRKNQRLGLRALMEVAGREAEQLDSTALAFALAPRLNAAGRLEHARLGVELLTTRCPQQAEGLARQLDTLNERRKSCEKSVSDEIEGRLSQTPELWQDGAIVEFGEEWHEGVIGITAGRLAERYGVPALVVSVRDGLAKGSGRSPENVDLFEVLKACQDLFLKYGGHPRAGGFSLAPEKLPDLRSAVLEAAARVKQGMAPRWVDGCLSLREVELSLVEQLEKLEPFGEGNPRPVFLLEGVTVVGQRRVGRDGDHLQLELEQAGLRRRAIGFRLGELAGELSPEKLKYDMLVQLGRESFRGEERLRLQVLGVVRPGELDLQRGESVIDLRHVRERRLWLERCLDFWPNSLAVCRDLETARRLFPRYQERLFDYSCPEPPSTEVLVLVSPPEDAVAFDRVVSGVQPDRLVLLFGKSELSHLGGSLTKNAWDRSTAEILWRKLRVSTRGSERFSRGEAVDLLVAQTGLSEGVVTEVMEAFQQTGVLFSESTTRLRFAGSSSRPLEETEIFQRKHVRSAGYFEVLNLFSGLNVSEKILQRWGPRRIESAGKSRSLLGGAQGKHANC